MITNRDIQIIETIKEFRILSSSQIQRLFNISKYICSRRMIEITNNIKEVKVKRYNPINNVYDNKYKGILKNENIYYYKKKPSAIVHDLLVNEFYLKLLEIDDFNVKEFKKEYRISMDDEFVVRADAYILMEIEGKEYEFLLEVENNKSFNNYKYSKLMEQGYVPLPIIVSTDRRIYNNNLEIIRVKLSQDDTKNKLKQYILEQNFGYKINKKTLKKG